MGREQSRTWALAMNSARARVLRGLAEAGVDQEVELVMKSEARNLRQSMSDGSGRDFRFRSPSRRTAPLAGSAAPGSDPVGDDRREFIRQVLAMLESHRRAGDFDKLAVFAEQDVLGTLRQMLPGTLRATVVCEVPRDLVHLSAQDLPRVILKAMDGGPQSL
ncbi:MAG: host attachment protein [Rhodobacter sp.]|nr:host attachment protein [Rhodobacter sp.]